MTDAQRPRRESETEVIPALTSGEGIARTQELPVVEGEAVQPPVPVAPPARSRPFWPLVAVLVIALCAGAFALVNRPRGTTGAGRPASSASPVTLAVTVSSLDPSGGSGFRPEGATWRTQTYASADFGNLKSGVGLLLDLGSPRAVSAVSFHVNSGPVTAELRGGDERAATEAGYTRVTDPATASGATALATKGGGAKHRYWLVWVSKLSAQDGGYRAVLTTPVVKGSAG